MDLLNFSDSALMVAADSLPAEFFAFCDLAESESASLGSGLTKLTKAEKSNQHFERVRLGRLKKRAEEHRRQRPARRERVRAGPVKLPFQLQVNIDLSFESVMNAKERSHLARQLGRIWGLQKLFDGLDTNIFGLTADFARECQRTCSGFDQYGWKTHAHRLDEVDKPSTSKLVYLSPDPEVPPLMTLDPASAYVIGGLVDESGAGSRTKQLADSNGHECFRLPIREFSTKTKEPGSWTFNQMLALNQVVESLCLFASGKTWAQALGAVVPKRTGFVFEMNQMQK